MVARFLEERILREAVVVGPFAKVVGDVEAAVVVRAVLEVDEDEVLIKYAIITV